MPPDEKGGYIIRTMAEDATEDDLGTDIQYLRVLWNRIVERRAVSAAPALLYQELSLAQRVLRDFATEETTTIQIDSRENFQKLQTFAQQLRAPRRRRSSSTTPASGRCSTCTRSRTRSRRRSRAASTSSPAAT